MISTAVYIGRARWSVSRAVLLPRGGFDKDTLGGYEQVLSAARGCRGVYISTTTWSSSERTSERASQPGRSPSGDKERHSLHALITTVFD